MKRKLLFFVVVIGFSLFCLVSNGVAESIQLPKPQLEGGKSLLQALQDRKSTRSLSSEMLSMQTISNLLWAAFGINRPDGRRTAPSARNWQEIDIYLASSGGLFLWDAKNNTLEQILSEDIRGLTGTQAYVKDAAINLIYVADFKKVSGGSTDQNTEVGADTGFISQNVYLYCASEGLGTVVRAMIDRDALGKAMKLRPEQKIILAQSVGFVKQ